MMLQKPLRAAEVPVPRVSVSWNVSTASITSLPEWGMGGNPRWNLLFVP